MSTFVSLFVPTPWFCVIVCPHTLYVTSLQEHVNGLTFFQRAMKVVAQLGAQLLLSCFFFHVTIFFKELSLPSVHDGFVYVLCCCCLSVQREYVRSG